MSGSASSSTGTPPRGALRMLGGIRDEQVEPRGPARGTLADRVEERRRGGSAVCDHEYLCRRLCLRDRDDFGGVLTRDAEVHDYAEDGNEEDPARHGRAQPEAADGRFLRQIVAKRR